MKLEEVNIGDIISFEKQGVVAIAINGRNLIGSNVYFNPITNTKMIFAYLHKKSFNNKYQLQEDLCNSGGFLENIKSTGRLNKLKLLGRVGSLNIITQDENESL
jgi:hypothetical protein